MFYLVFNDYLFEVISSILFYSVGYNYINVSLSSFSESKGSLSRSYSIDIFLSLFYSLNFLAILFSDNLLLNVKGELGLKSLPPYDLSFYSY